MPLARGRSAPQNTFLETLANKFDGTISNFVLGNAQSIKDYPIVYCSDGFCDLTGYSRTDVMCRSCSCKFLVGMDTQKDALYKINRSLHDKTEMKTEILFYKKNGAPFWCLLDLMPIKNEIGEVVLFLVSHKDVTKQKLSSAEGNIRPDPDSLGNGFATDAPVPRLRKFSRDVLLHIQRQYSGKTPLPKSRTMFTQSSPTVGESSSFIPQYKLENAKLPRFMILHFGRPRLIWDWVILLLVCYIAIMVPFNVAFKTHDRTKEFIIADTVVEVFFIIDIVINFRTTYIDKKSGRIITQTKLIAMHYLKGWFFVDFLAALPFEALYFTNHSWGFLVSLLKTGRLLRLFRIARRVSRYIEYTAALLGLLMFSFALLGHWFACIWYVIGYEELRDRRMHGWLHALGEQVGKPYVNASIHTGPSKGEAYISSLYFILTSLTTVGFGNIAPNTAAEKIFSVVVLLLGALMQSAIFGNMTAIIQKLYSVRARFHAKANEIKQFVRLHRIENDLKRRIEDYFLTHWSVSKGVDTNEMLESFPSELQADICLHMYRNFLNLPCFADTSRGCWRLLSLKVKRAYFGPGELILKEKDAIDAIFFVNSGTIEIVQRECIVAILGSGDLFGEDVSRKTPIRRSNGDVRALTYCDLLYLSRANLLGVLHLYPDFAETFSQKLEMTFNLGLRERELSNGGPLDSITEGDEEDDGSDTTEDESHESRALLSESKASSPTTSQLPLWQRRIRNLECHSSSVASLHERLMRIESESSDEDSNQAAGSSRESLKENLFKTQSLRKRSRKSQTVDHIELSELSSGRNVCNGDDNELVSSQTSVNISSDGVKETVVNDTGQSSDEHDSDDGSVIEYDEFCNPPNTNENPMDSLLKLDTLSSSDTSHSCNPCASLLEHELVSKSETNSCDAMLSGMGVGRRPARPRRISYIPESPAISNDAANVVDSISEILAPKCSETSKDLHERKDSLNFENMTPINEPTCNGTYTPSKLSSSTSSLVEHSSNHPVFETEVVINQTGSKWPSSNDMYWDMLCPSLTENRAGSLSDITQKTGRNLLRAEGHIKDSKHQIERLSSGVFSRLTDSEPELTNPTRSRNGLKNQACCNHRLGGSQNSFLDDEAHVFRKADFASPGSERRYYCSNMQDFSLDAKVNDGSATREDRTMLVCNENCNVSRLDKRVSESQEAILNMTRRIDCIGSDVEGLKRDMRSIASMVRLLVERQSNTCTVGKADDIPRQSPVVYQLDPSQNV